MIFTVSNSLSLNPSSTITVTLTPKSATEMEIDFVDTVQQLAVTGGTVTSSSWQASNSTLVIHSTTSTQTIQVGI
jgi:cytochrome c oxidase assembly protein Cox11